MPVAIPSPLSSFYQHFPLLLLPSHIQSSVPPSLSQIWALGPPPTGHSESLDPLCRAAQAFTRFANLPVDDKVRWVTWDQREVAPGGAFPAVHATNGDLLVGEQVEEWLSKELAKGGKASDGGKRTDEASSPERKSAQQDPTHQAYTALVESALLPAVLCALYLSPAGTAPAVVPQRRKPVLSALAGSLLSWNDRSERIEEVKRLRGGKGGKKTVLDLEEVEREAGEALEALEVKIKAVSKGRETKWFGGSRCVLLSSSSFRPSSAHLFTS